MTASLHKRGKASHVPPTHFHPPSRSIQKNRFIHSKPIQCVQFQLNSHFRVHGNSNGHEVPNGCQPFKIFWTWLRMQTTEVSEHRHIQSAHNSRLDGCLRQTVSPRLPRILMNSKCGTAQHVPQCLSGACVSVNASKQAFDHKSHLIFFKLFFSVVRTSTARCWCQRQGLAGPTYQNQHPKAAA